jgi:hypothetical protein
MSGEPWRLGRMAGLRKQVHHRDAFPLDDPRRLG